ncbi:MAG: hypothetical protein RR447_10255, partial [Algoriella sp.]
MNGIVKIGDKIGESLEGFGIISKRKYEYLKSFSANGLKSEELEQIKLYEEIESVKKSEFIPVPIVEKQKLKKIETLDSDFIFEKFKEFWFTTQKKELILNQENKKLIFALCKYFGKQAGPFDNKKGLILSGDCGVGKTSTILTFIEIGKWIYKERVDMFMCFRQISTNEMVYMYENPETDVEKFHQLLANGEWYFDDFGTERMASRYGKTNLLEEVLQNRYLNLKNRTLITTNL